MIITEENQQPVEKKRGAGKKKLSIGELSLASNERLFLLFCDLSVYY